ncbi:hypothetical protein [Nocardia sp. NPDC057030]|uniref:hypothetical protein n=1 Tax=unclassified Nocardia TaxID=2637762 RepID=UPI00362B5770
MTDQTPAPEDLAAACARLQGELDAMLGTRDADEAVGSLDQAVASLKGVEHRNVSSVQLVALD